MISRAVSLRWFGRGFKKMILDAGNAIRRDVVRRLPMNEGQVVGRGSSGITFATAPAGVFPMAAK